MIDQRYRDLAGAAEEAARPPEFAAVRRRGGRLRARRRAGGALAAAVLVATGVASTAVLLPSGADPIGSAAGGQVFSAAAADAEHLYAIKADCAECPRVVVASRDGGRSWEERGVKLPAASSPRVTVLGREILLFNWVDSRTDTNSFPPGDHPARPGGIPEWSVSVDGGRTMRDAKISSTPVAAAAPGTRVVRCFDIGQSAVSSPCQVFAVDPESGRFAPLANQPRGFSHFIEAPAAVGFWAIGYDDATRQFAILVSQDRGRTWQTRPIQAREADSILDLATTDGRLVYAVFTPRPDPIHISVPPSAASVPSATFSPDPDSLRRKPQIYRSTDGGLHWERTSAGDGGLRVPGVRPGSMITSDGTHVMTESDSSGWHYIGSADGRSYSRIDLRGLPALGHQPSKVTLPAAVADGLFIHVYDGVLYTSRDGRNWRSALRGG